MEFFEGLKYEEESEATPTSSEQCACEELCASFLKPFYCYDSKTLNNLYLGGLINEEQDIMLLRSKHINYLVHNLQTTLPSGFVSLDASRPWLCYWILHALYLMGHEPSGLHSRVVQFLQHIQNISGGFGGGPGQISQGAPNYAAILSLCTIGTVEALSIVNRQTMYQHFLRCKHSSGGFCIHVDGEVDTRSTYTVISIARILNILTPELTCGVADFILQCQTYEGGFGGEPGNEAHGGYNFCAIASLLILKEASRCNIKALKHWLLSRQMRLEGGFQGRTNKLVDSCYSFWQGAAVAILQIIEEGGDDIHDLSHFLLLSQQNNNFTSEQTSSDEIRVESVGVEETIHKVTNTSGNLLFNQKMLQKYVLHCSQNVEVGGLRDKPNKTRDFYHTCYSLSGMSIAQNTIIRNGYPEASNSPVFRDDSEDVDDLIPEIDYCWRGKEVYGDMSNVLEPTSVVFNIGLLKLKFALEYYKNYPNNHEYLILS